MKLHEMIDKNEEKREEITTLVHSKMTLVLATMANYFVSEESGSAKLDPQNTKLDDIKKHVLSRTLSNEQRIQLVTTFNLPLSYDEEHDRYNYIASTETLFFPGPSFRERLRFNQTKAEAKYFKELAQALTLIHTIHSVYEMIQKPHPYERLKNYNELYEQALSCVEQSARLHELDFETLKENLSEVSTVIDNIKFYLNDMNTLIINIDKTKENATAYQKNFADMYSSLQTLFAKYLAESKDSSWGEALNGIIRNLFNENFESIMQGEIDLSPDITPKFEAYTAGVQGVIDNFHIKQEAVENLLREQKRQLEQLQKTLRDRIQTEYREREKEKLHERISKYHSQEFNKKLVDAKKIVSGNREHLKKKINVFRAQHKGIEVDRIYALIEDLERISIVFLNELNDARENLNFTDEQLADMKQRKNIEDKIQQTETAYNNYASFCKNTVYICNQLTRTPDPDEDKTRAMNEQKVWLTYAMRNVQKLISENQTMIPDVSLRDRALSLLGSLLKNIGVTLSDGKLKEAIEKSKLSISQKEAPKAIADMAGTFEAETTKQTSAFEA